MGVAVTAESVTSTNTEYSFRGDEGPAGDFRSLCGKSSATGPFFKGCETDIKA